MKSKSIRNKCIVLTMCVALVIASCLAIFVGCNDTDDKDSRVMNLSLNPQVEFILDSEDKVVSVNAINEEGNLIITSCDFIGKSAPEAAKLFVEVSKETGFIIQGSVEADENNIKIAISGEADINALYNSVKQNINDYIQESGITVRIADAVKVSRDELEKLVAECAPYLEKAKIEAMKYDELIQELVKSRKETAEFYSQELKNAYYEAKAYAMQQAELETLKSYMNEAQKYVYDTVNGVYTQAVDAIEEIRLNVLVKEDSIYQTALSAFRSAKTEYLNFRNYVAELPEGAVTEDMTNILASLDAVLESAQSALEQAKISANDMLDSAKTQVDTAYNAVIDFIKSSSIKANDHIDEISAKQKDAQDKFFTSFENGYASAISKAQSSWEQMQDALERGYVEEA